MKIDQKHIVIAGAGTSGLTTAIILKKTFPLYDITVCFSEKSPIIGVGEGSTEHWRWFQDFVGINVDDMIKFAGVTHKYGIMFEGWNNHTPKYIHSVSGTGIKRNSFYATYSFLLENEILLTNSLSWKGMIEDQVIDGISEDDTEPDKTHLGTNQYHFDTFLLNKYLKNFANNMGIRFVEGEIESVNKGSNGHIKYIKVNGFDSKISGDFFIDATGFARVLSSKMQNVEFNSFSEYLPCDTALVFQTDKDIFGKIHPYTRAISMNAGWMWEIPTQERKGNGYVFSSSYITEEEAIIEAEEFHGIEIENPRFIKFRPGYYSEPWQKNCVSIGLSYSFIEPLEATTISIGIQQARLLCSYIANFNEKTEFSIREYNKIMNEVMENALSMICLHYISDRNDTKMWLDQQNRPKPLMLQKLLEIWSERPPEDHDITANGFELFFIPHFWHVAQGQGVLNSESAAVSLNAHLSRRIATQHLSETNSNLINLKMIDHGEAIERTKNRDS